MVNEAPSSGELARLPLGEVLDRIAARTPAPGGGVGAALAAAVAAALVEMASGFDDSPAAGSRGARAGELRALALELAERDLESYAPVLRALRLPAEDPQRSEQLAAALSVAADAPFGIAEVGAELAGLAVGAADTGSRHLFGDAAAAAMLSEAACRAAAQLVKLNLHDTADPRLEEAGRLVQTAMVASQHATAAGGEK